MYFCYGNGQNAQRGSSVKFKAIVLDFDGTLIDSCDVKDKAFMELFRHTSRLDEIMRYHKAHSAVIRYEKFRYITEEILGQVYTKEIGGLLSEKFSRYVYERSLKCPFIDGAVEFLDYFYGVAPIYLASINPAEELERMLDVRGLRRYFKEVYAHPWAKKDAAREIAVSEGLSGGEVVFIGDTLEDYNAASDAGAFFVARSDGDLFNCVDVPVYANLSDIKEFIKTIG